MTRTEKVGHVQFTIRVSMTACDDDEAMSVLERIHSLFQAASVPSTWAIHSEHCRLIEDLALGSPATEVALQGPQSLIHFPMDRCRFRSWLVGALETMKRSMQDVTSFFLAGGDVAGQWDILVQNGIRVVSFSASRSHRSSFALQSFRHGMLWLASSSEVPGCGRFLGAWDAGYRAKASLAQAMRRHGSQQIVVDMSRFTGSVARPWRSLESVLKITNMAVAAGSLRGETLRQTGARLAPTRAPRSMQSILRAA